jgi:hypothetical protein
MGAGGEKFPQARRGQRDSVGPHHAGNIKARCPRGGYEFGLERGEI